MAAPSDGSSDYHVMFLAERGPAPLTAAGQRSWIIDVYFDDVRIHERLPIHDPFSGEKHVKCREYLNEYLHKKPFPRAKADKRSNAIDQYRRELFAQLPLGRCSFTKLKVKVDVGECVGASGSMYTIHCLHWEHLEDLALWPAKLSSVTVRRMVASPSRTIQIVQGLRRATTWTVRGRPPNMINVLLVIARKLHPDMRDVRPSQAQIAILKVQEVLRANHSPYQVRLEIVRPGTYKAFKQHLKKRSGVFHLVHFDVHGEIQSDEEYVVSRMFSNNVVTLTSEFL
jgi:hypothetical protein